MICIAHAIKKIILLQKTNKIPIALYCQEAAIWNIYNIII